MRWRLLAAILFGLVLACGGSTSPQGTSCESEGATKYSSKHGTFTCVDTGSGLRWERT